MSGVAIYIPSQKASTNEDDNDLVGTHELGREILFVMKNQDMLIVSVPKQQTWSEYLYDVAAVVYNQIPSLKRH